MAATEADTKEINYPEWTEYRKKNGLDPLGMQNSSISLYQTFLPGISNVTTGVRGRSAGEPGDDAGPCRVQQPRGVSSVFRRRRFRRDVPAGRDVGVVVARLDTRLHRGRKHVSRRS